MKSSNHAIGNNFYKKHNIRRSSWQIDVGWVLVVVFTCISVYATMYAATCRPLIWW